MLFSTLWSVLLSNRQNREHLQCFSNVYYLTIDHSRKYQNIPQCSLFVTPKFCISIVFIFSWELKWPQEKLKTMLMQNFGVTTNSIMVCYGIFWSGQQWLFIRNYLFSRWSFLSQILTSVRPTPITVTSMRSVIIPRDLIIAPVSLDTLETEETAVVITFLFFV